MKTPKARGDQAGRLRVRLGDERDRDAIYRLRHAVYAQELGQHPESAEGRLSDALDGHNLYLVAERGDALEGFISITPPGHRGGLGDPGYSLEKYVARGDLPFALDDRAFEVRLLTVPSPARGTRHLPLLLMWAALRWVEAHRGERIIGMGRRRLMRSYRRLGLDPTGIEVRSGAVTFEIMHATTASLRERALRYGSRLRRLAAEVDWQLAVPFAPPVGCFHGGAFFDAIGPRFDALNRRREVINADVLDAWFDPSPRVLAALAEHLPWLLRTSPPTACEGLVAAIAEARGVEPAAVLPGAGSSALIFLALRHWLTPASRALILDPTYGEYAHVLARVVGCRVDRFVLSRGDGYDVDPDRLAGRLARPYDLVVLVNPNSPTGRLLSPDRVRALAAAAPPPTRFWIDETYVDFAGPGLSLERAATAGTNLVVCKSMSKAYALSGARVGYLCGPPDLIAELRGLNPPWAVGLPSQVAAVAALADPAYYQRRWQQTHALREALAGRLREECGFDVVPAAANFLLCHLPAAGPGARRLIEACRGDGLFLRDASAMGRALGDRAVRIAVKDRATNDRMVEILTRHCR